MNKQIKFRAWDKSFEMMYEVDAIRFFDELIEVDNEEDHQTDNINKYEVMQYTGLKDTNGTEIYEGDIVRLQSVDGVDYNAQIVFKDGGFCAIDGAIDNFAVSRYNLTIFDLEITVIGNIYENPELLERDEE